MNKVETAQPSMITELLISSEKEFTDWKDINPNKVLRPIGTIFKEWIENITSTEPARFYTWEVVGYFQSYRGRRGNIGLYERMEEIRLADEELKRILNNTETIADSKYSELKER